MTDATAEEFKAQGNELYKRGDYQRAIDKYTQAIDAAPTVVAYYGNRAAASFMLGKHKDVVTDCNRAIVFDPLYMKGYVRKAKAQLAMVSRAHNCHKKYCHNLLLSMTNNHNLLLLPVG